jgi:hypothetical protein
VRGICAVDDVGGMNARCKFLLDALKQSLGAGALDLYLDIRISRLEGLSEFFPHGKIHRGIQHHLAFLYCRFDQLWRDRLHLRGGSLQRRGENRQAKRRRASDDAAPGYGCAHRLGFLFPVIARSPRDDAIHSACMVAMDCFAEPVIGRACARPVGSQ